MHRQFSLMPRSISRKGGQLTTVQGEKRKQTKKHENNRCLSSYSRAASCSFLSKGDLKKGAFSILFAGYIIIPAGGYVKRKTHNHALQAYF